MKESDLYAPVKSWLEARGFTVKAEIGACDVVATQPQGELVVVELKRTLSLALVLQGVERRTISEEVYLCVPSTCAALRRKRRAMIRLLRMLGLGLLTVDSRDRVRAVLHPGPYAPRLSPTRRRRVLAEFERRAGDPNEGGASSRAGRVTAYRQRAQRLALWLQAHGATRAVEVARATGEAQARQILYRNVHGWFERTARGVYGVSSTGAREVERLRCAPVEPD